MNLTIFEKKLIYLSKIYLINFINYFSKLFPQNFYYLKIVKLIKF